MLVAGQDLLQFGVRERLALNALNVWHRSALSHQLQCPHAVLANATEQIKGLGGIGLIARHHPVSYFRVIWQQIIEEVIGLIALVALLA